MNTHQTTSFFPYKGFPQIPEFSSENEIEIFLENIRNTTKHSLSTLLGIENQILLKDFSTDLLSTLDNDIHDIKLQNKSPHHFHPNKKNIETYLNLGKDYQNRYKNTKNLITSRFPDDDIDYLVKLLASTSINTSVKGNVTIFNEVKKMLEKNEFDESKYRLVKEQISRIQQGESLSGPKIHQYHQAIMGNEKAVTVDTRIGRAFNIERMRKKGTGSLSPLDHLSIRHYIRLKAKEYGLTPAEMTVMIRRGIRIEKKLSLKDYSDYL